MGAQHGAFDVFTQLKEGQGHVNIFTLESSDLSTGSEWINKMVKEWLEALPLQQSKIIYFFVKIHMFYCLVFTLPETNIASENGWLEDYFPFGMLVPGSVRFFQLVVFFFQLVRCSFQHHSQLSRGTIDSANSRAVEPRLAPFRKLTDPTKRETRKIIDSKMPCPRDPNSSPKRSEWWTMEPKYLDTFVYGDEIHPQTLIIWRSVRWLHPWGWDRIC